jgi:hypothetical protein
MYVHLHSPPHSLSLVELDESKHPADWRPAPSSAPETRRSRGFITSTAGRSDDQMKARFSLQGEV